MPPPGSLHSQTAQAAALYMDDAQQTATKRILPNGSTMRQQVAAPQEGDGMENRKMKSRHNFNKGKVSPMKYQSLNPSRSVDQTSYQGTSNE